MSIFEKYVIAHLIADFLLQNNWMALNKGGWKWKNSIACQVHSLIYGVCMGLIFRSIDVFCYTTAIHFFFDKIPVTELWLRFIRGRSFKSLKSIHKLSLCMDPLAGDVYVGFTCVVYTVADFLIHFITTFPIVYFLIKEKA